MATLRITCPLPSCVWGEGDEINTRWKTDPHYTMIAEAQTALGFHMEAHKLAGPVVQPTQLVQQQQQNRIPKGIIPKLEAHITNQDWGYFEGKWRRYKEYCNLVQEKDLVHNLWECLSDELIRAARDDRFEDGSVETEAVFLERVKKLAVKNQYTLVG